MFAKKTKFSFGGVLFAVLTALAVFLVAYRFPWIGEYFIDKLSENTVEEIDGVLYVHYIDVGQGNAALVKTPEGSVMLIDSGTDESKSDLVYYLRKYGVKTIEFFVLTHPHEDHIGGAPEVFKNFEVKNVIVPDIISDTTTFSVLLDSIESEECAVITASYGSETKLGSASFKILGPLQIDRDDLNECSIVLRLNFGITGFLFTGDAGEASEERMLSVFSNEEFKADVLCAGHHGSSSSSTEAFIQAVSPKFAVISCGANNEHGHPHIKTLNLFQKLNIFVYRTDKNGSIVFYSNGNSVAYAG
ncbi:MAG: ComEC/Rec2 family competence protein [Firmicutes bacterium]|nr:ComEC/Rec2 family competence protein [Bacillota bacterium]